MIIYPKSANLLTKICELAAEHKLWPFGQYRINQYLINMHRFPDECLVFDENEIIVDGYVVSDTELKYNDKTFTELLNNLLK